MDTAGSQGRRQATSKTSHRRDLDFAISPDTDVKSPSRSDHEWFSSTNIESASIAHVSRGSEAALANAMSAPGQACDVENTSHSRTAHKSSDRREGQKKVHAKVSPREAVNGSFQTAQHALVADKKISTFPERLKDQKTWGNSKASSQIPKSKKSDRGAAQSTEMEMVSTGQSSSCVQKIVNVEPTAQNKYASMPIIRLSYEDSETQIGMENDSNTLNMLPDTAKVIGKDNKVTHRTTLIEKKSKRPSSSENGREKSMKSLNKCSSGDRGTNELDKSLLNERQGHSKSMQLLIPKRHHRRRDTTRKSESNANEISLSRTTNSTVLPQKRSSSAQKTPTSLKILHSLKKFSIRGSKSTSISPTLSRPRKKFSRGHISQDPLEVGYEILDDTVTTVVPRVSIPSLAEKRRSVPNYEHRKSSVEEPLLSKNLDSEIKLDKHPPKSLRIPFMQTFPRTKHQRSEQYSSFLELSPSRKTPTSSLSETASHFISNQLQSPQSTFTTFHKSPSSSSFISADARSEVCLDLADAACQSDYDHQTDAVDREVFDFRAILGFPSAPYTRIIHYTQQSILMVLLSAVCTTIASLILLLPLLVLVIFITPVVLLVKCFCNWLCCCRISLMGFCWSYVCHTHLTSSELLWLDEEAEGASAVVQCLLVLQKGLDTDRIRSVIDSRLLSVENRRGRKIYPRFTQKVVNFGCGRAWVTDSHFMISKHVYNMPGYIETLEDLQHFISKMAGEPVSRDHPLWEIQVLHNFREPRDTVLLFRMHLSMADGVSLVHVLEDALVDSQKISHPKREFSRQISHVSALRILFCGPVTFLTKYFFKRPDHNILHGAHFCPSGEMVVAWSEPFSLSAAMRIKQVARCTLGELFLSTTAGNLRTYFQMFGISHPYNIKCIVPVDFHEDIDAGWEMGNNYSLVIMQLPTNTEGIIPRLWQVKYDMAQFKSSAEAAIVHDARWLTCSVLPVSSFQRMWRKIYNKCTMLVSNLAGPTSTLKIDSREVKCMMYWAPPVEKVPLTVSFITYADQVRMTVICDRSVIHNPDLLTRDFIYKLETLSKLLAHRRIPEDAACRARYETTRSLSSLTLDDLTADQIQLEISLVEQEVHDLKIQLNSSSSHRISDDDLQLISRIETLKERSRELMLHLRRRKAEESENAMILSEEESMESELGTDKQQKPFRRRTLSMSSKMSSMSVSSTARPLSTASASSAPSPIHTGLPSWPESDHRIEETDKNIPSRYANSSSQGTFGKQDGVVNRPATTSTDDKGSYQNIVS